MTSTKRFCLYLIKPSHYDDDGYVIQWRLSPIPSNSLASVYGLVRDAIDRQAMGPEWDFDVRPVDETNTEIDIRAIIEDVRGADGGLVMLIGVQSNQFPRSLDIARPLLAAGIQVAIGGFHVSGVISMLNGEDADFRRAREMGISLFAGELEGRIEQVLGDAVAGRLQPLYNYMNDLPGIEGTPLPGS